MPSEDRSVHPTPVQIAKLRRHRRQWIDRAQASVSGDRDRAEASADQAYQAAGLEPPQAKLWFHSPLDAWIATDLLLHAGSPRLQQDFGLLWGRETEQRIWAAINAQLSEDLEAPLSPVKDTVISKVLTRVREKIPLDPIFQGIMLQRHWGGPELPSQTAFIRLLRARAKQIARDIRRERLRRMAEERVSPRLWKQISNSAIWDQMFDLAERGALRCVEEGGADLLRLFEDKSIKASQVDSLLRAFSGFNWTEALSPQWMRMDLMAGYGVHDCLFLGFLDFLLKEFECHCVLQLEGLSELATACGMWWPLDKAIVFSDPPSQLSLNNDGMLHHNTGPALVSSEDVEIWAWNGQTYSSVPGEADTLVSAATIRRERNLEVRRFLLRVYGEARYLIESGAQVIHQDHCGILYSLSQPQQEPLVMVKVWNATPEPDGTFKEYFLRVPPWITRAREAVAWTFGIDEQDYRPKKES